MINYETLISSYDGKLTLMQWLKKVEVALEGASAVSFKVNKRGDATLTFSVVFEDGSELETSPIVLQQGESVQGAAIRNGHLILMLTNGDELDAGNLGAVSGFSINASQHLIVTYQNGTTQDLGAIFTGDVAITGSLAAAAVKTASLTSDEAEISAQKPVVEVMTGYSVNELSPENYDLNIQYSGIVKNGNKLTFAVAGRIKKTSDASGPVSLVNIGFPANIGAKLIPLVHSESANHIDNDVIPLFSASNTYISVPFRLIKLSNTAAQLVLQGTTLIVGTEYIFRYEVTFLLSDNLAAEDR